MAAEEVVGGNKGLAFLDLPLETQRDIFSHCAQSDLICLALVSKHFHELASALLYRNFHIIFPDDDDLDMDSPIDGLAGGLDTFTTSDYNYAKHLKDLSMDTLSAGEKGEQSYQSYLYSASCGKFLNSLLYLTLKKARSLEAFRWNIRVELSRPVYRVLHQIPSLKRLHLRMQAGESYYTPPPPLPVSATIQSQPQPPAPVHHWYEVSPLSPDAPPAGSSLLPPSAASPPGPPGPPPALVPPSKSLSRSKASKRSLSLREPATIAGFKKLQSLAVLDIDNLDIVTELRTCIKHSSSTLTELQLSLSDSLASQARKPPPDSEPEDSDVDDEFQVVPASPNTSFDATGPAKVFRAQEERKLQEAVLGRIFDVEPYLMKKPHMRQKPDDSDEANGKKGGEGASGAKDPREEFVNSLKGVSTKLMCLLNGSRDLSISQQDILDTIEKAARKYVASGDLPTSENRAPSGPGADQARDTQQAGKPNDSNEVPAPGPSSDANQANTTKSIEGESESAGPSGGSVGEAAPISLPSRTKITENDTQPEDIDISQPVPAEELPDDPTDSLVPQVDTATTGEDEASQPAASQETMGLPTDNVSSDPAASEATAAWDEQAYINGLLTKIIHFHNQAEVLEQRVQEIHAANPDENDALPHLKAVETQLRSLHKNIVSLQRQVAGAETRVHGLSRDSKSETTKTKMGDYVRDTRGFLLESLSIHLIPVKASVLSRGIDLHCLKQLTLLNVGNQAPIWTLLAKENKSRPLSLRSVFTDNVSNAFLACMSQLDELHELFLLERGPKHKPESFAPRSSTTIDQIRRLVLKKHMATLRRLMIKDESNGPSWDANEKTMILICSRGVKLEELAVSMNIHAVHAFMQYFSGLVSLRAINILHFRNNDTCIWVMREILRFIVDNLSHHPELKLEWIAMEDDRVDRVLRPSESTESRADPSQDRAKTKSKGKQPVNPGDESPFPWLPVEALDSESESEDDGFDCGTRLRFKTVGPLQFYDVWGVKIFEKEIRSGRL